MDEHPHDPRRDPIDEGAPPTNEALDAPTDGETGATGEPGTPDEAPGEGSSAGDFAAHPPGTGAYASSGDPNSIDVYPTLRRGLAAAVRAFPRAALVLLPVTIVTQAVSIFGAPDLFLGSGTPGVPPQLGASEWLVFAGLLVFQLTFGTWMQGALLFVGEASLDGAALPSFGAAYGRALDRVPSMLVTGILFVLCVALGTLLCIAPGVWVGATLAWAIVRAGVRDEGPLIAIRHSYLLSRGRVLRVVGALLTVFALTLPLAFLVGATSAAMRLTGHTLSTPAELAPFVVLQVVAGLVLAPAIVCMQLALHERLETLGPKT
jgi:hypothetical protein